MKIKKQNIYLPLPNGKEAHITNCIHRSPSMESPVELNEELWVVHAMPYVDQDGELCRGKEFATKNDAINFVSHIQTFQK